MTAPGGTGRFEQNVTATAGFAYGVIGADIHVFGDGTPLYVLTSWSQPPGVDADWLRALPSRMLNGRYAVVDFTGRTDELAQLHHWRQTGPRLGLRWLYGPGGTGKSRLASQFAAESIDLGWKVVTAVQGPGTVIPPPGSQDLSLDGYAGLLLIVDYADRWPLSRLTWLLSNALLHQVGKPARVLLLARGLDGWPAVRAAAANHQADTSALFLPTLDRDHRAEMFTAAQTSFAHRLAQPAVPAADLSSLLDEPEMGLVLALHVAALVSVDAHINGRQPPHGMAALTMYLLDREHLHWANLYSNRDHASVASDRGYVTPPEAMNKVVFAAALTGPVNRAAGTNVIEELDLPIAAGRTLADHALCYPPASDDGQTVLEPLYPDRLAEDFLALTIPGHPVDYPSQLWASATVRVMVANVDALRGYDRSRALTFLAFAADRWPHVGQECLFPLLRDHPRVAVEAGSAVLSAVAGIEDVDIDILEEIESSLPDEVRVDLAVGVAAVIKRLTEHRLTQTTDPAEHAALYDYLAECMDDAGRTEEALTAATATVALCRQLAVDAPAEQLPGLTAALTTFGDLSRRSGRDEDALAAAEEALSILRRIEPEPDDKQDHLRATASTLSSLSAIRSTVGQWDAAVAAAQEATDIYSHLAADEPDTDRFKRAAALTNFGQCLIRAGRRAEALVPMQQAVALCRLLAEANPASHAPDLARALLNIGAHLADLSRLPEATGPSQEAVALYRQLADINPAAYLLELGTALHNHAVLLNDLARPAEAHDMILEALAIRRKLAQTNPAAHLPEVGHSLSSLASTAHALGAAQEALASETEAVELFRWLANHDSSHTASLAGKLHNLGILFESMGQHQQALASTQEAVTARRQLAAASPAVYLPALASSLNSLSIKLSKQGRHHEALAAGQEAAMAYRQLGKAELATHLHAFAASLTSLANRLTNLGRHEEALAVGHEAVTVRRELALANPGSYLTELATTLNNFGGQLANLRRHQEGLPFTQEAVAIVRQLVQANPTAHLPDLGQKLNSLGNRLSSAGRKQEALAAFHEAVDICRRLAATDSAVHLPDLANALDGFARELDDAGLQREALAAMEEAVAISRHLAQQNPAAHQAQLASSLHNIGIQLADMGWWPPAIAATEEAVAILRHHASINPETHLPLLASALHNLGILYTRVGRKRPAKEASREAEAIRQHIR